MTLRNFGQKIKGVNLIITTFSEVYIYKFKFEDIDFLDFLHHWNGKDSNSQPRTFLGQLNYHLIPRNSYMKPALLSKLIEGCEYFYKKVFVQEKLSFESYRN
jgi:hypothetical protein